MEGCEEGDLATLTLSPSPPGDRIGERTGGTRTELVDGVGSAAIIGETGTVVDIREAGIEGDVREAGTEGDVVKEGTGACAATSTEGELIWWCVEREEPAL